MIEGTKVRVNGCESIPEHMYHVPVLVTKEFTFDSAHHLKNYSGKCEYSHGHTYKLQVTLKGVPDCDGLLVDFNDMKKEVGKILEPVDHNYLNEYFNFNSTCENMVKWFWCVMEDICPSGVYLEEIKLWETPTSFATLNSAMVRGVK